MITITPQVDNTKYAAVGAYIFAGGFSVGVSKYFDTFLHLESDSYGKEMKDHNMPWIDTIVGVNNWPKVNADFVYCNPPCAVWSNASHGRTTHWSEDPRISCFHDSFNLLDNEPTVLAIETVLATWRKAQNFILDLCKKGNERGYAATVLLHDGKYLKLPQQRRRMFVVFHQLHLAWYSYNPSPEIACDRALIDPPLLGDDQILSADDHAQYLLIHRRPTDSTLVQIHDRLGFNKGIGSKRPVFSSSICKPGRPAPTLLHCMHAHPIEKRYLTIREMARLTSYPDDWDWMLHKGGPQAKASLIARGVTPTVGGWLASLVHETLECGSSIERPYTVIADILKGPLSLQEVEL